MPSYDQVLGTFADDYIADQIGNTHILAGAGDDSIYAKIQPFYEVNIFDGGSGTDRVTFEGQVSASLQTGLALRIDHMTGFINGADQLVDIEDLTGGNFADTLTGDAGANIIYGRDGDDVINGGGGRDLLVGGRGVDTINGGAGNDFLSGFDYHSGGSAANDVLNGGAGIDIAYYYPLYEDADIAYAPRSMTVDLAAGTASSFFVGTDTLIDIEGVHTGSRSDTIFGSADADIVYSSGGSDFVTVGGGDDQVFGGWGDDTIIGGAGNDLLEGARGEDTIDGGSGTDTASFGQTALHTRTDYDLLDAPIIDSFASFDIDLGAGTAEVTDADHAYYIGEIDTLVSIENIIAYDGNDNVVGSGFANVIETGAGNDTLDGGTGNDTLNGGADVDTLIYATNTAAVVDLAAGTSSGALGNDTLIDIENVKSGAGDDQITGDDGDNRFDSFGGDDTLIGLGGDDIMFAGTGNDTLLGGDGDDSLYGMWDDDRIRGGAGDDLIVGGTGNDVLIWGHGDAVGLDEVGLFQIGSDSLEFLDGFLAENVKTGSDITQLLDAVEGTDGAVLRANTVEAGWQDIAEFTSLSVDQLDQVIATDASIISHDVGAEIGVLV